MRFLRFLIIILLIVSGCSMSSKLQVTRLGYEPNEVIEKMIYTLPQTVIKIEVVYEHTTHIPGPYAEYAEKYLGIRNARDSRQESWNLIHGSVTGLKEIDPDHYYVINALSGSIPDRVLDHLIGKGIVLNGLSESEDPGSLIINGQQDQYSPVYQDVTIETYTEQKEKTMYKTIVTDTSFIEVPVSRTVLEKKTLEQKAEEAANFIFELRLSRFELLSGYGEVFPNGAAMESTLKKLDELENEYLSLFIGKQKIEFGKRVYFITPETDEDQRSYPVAYFSNKLGFVPVSMEEGSPLNVIVSPINKTTSLRNLMPQTPEEEVYDLLYYRLPDVAEVSLEWEGNSLYIKRMDIYQLGALVSEPIAE